jgi:hypothetical protein
MLKSFRIADFCKLKELGSGSFGVVWKVEEHESKKQYFQN